MTLSTFLTALPPSLKDGHFDGFHFRHDDEIKWVKTFPEEAFIKCMCTLSVEDSVDGRPQAATATAVVDLRGAKSWCLLPQRASALLLFTLQSP